MNPQYLEQLERDIRTRARALDQKRKAIGPEQKRITVGVDFVTKLTAASFDLLGLGLNFIPVVGNVSASVLAIAGNIGMFLTYYIVGVKPLEGKKQVTARLQKASQNIAASSMFKSAATRSFKLRIAALFAELIPIINALPAFSVAVWYTNHVVSKEDKEYNMKRQAALQQLSQEENMLQVDMRNYAQMVHEYEIMSYNREVEEEKAIVQQIQDEAAITNAIQQQEDDEEDRRAA